MSTFTALNLEPEDISEDEIDDTKEIQLEEAFKLYQNALKLHSQGPAFYAEARNAYDELFQSEVFKYPEIVSEFAHDELDDPSDDPTLISEAVPLGLVSADSTDTSHNSLPQLIYLAYKNRGQFYLDYAQPRSFRPPEAPDSLVEPGRKALGSFADALERDDTDLDLWRKSAKVGRLLASHRTVRFCLESVIATDDPTGSDSVDLSGLDEALAAKELEQLLSTLKDDLSISSMTASQAKGPLLELLKRRLEPFPVLLQEDQETESIEARASLVSFQPQKHLLRPSTPSWSAVGQSLLQCLTGEQQGTLDLGPGAAVVVDLPHALHITTASENPGNDNATHTIARLGQITGSEDTVTASPDGVDAMRTDEKATGDGDATDGAVRRQEDEQTTDLPTAQVDRASSEISFIPAEAKPSTQGQPEHDVGDETSAVVLPTRKRSSTTAGIEEPGDAVRVKSKRLRARESNIDLTLPEEDANVYSTQYYEDRLQEYSYTDQWLWEVLESLYIKFGIEGDKNPIRLMAYSRNEHLVQSSAEPATTESFGSGVDHGADLKEALISWNDEKAAAFTHGHGVTDSAGGKAGLTLFMEHSKPYASQQMSKLQPLGDSGLQAFVDDLHQSWTGCNEAVVLWLGHLLKSPRNGDAILIEQAAGDSAPASAYLNSTWSDELKQTLVRLIVADDEHIYDLMQTSLDAFELKLPTIEDEHAAAQPDIAEIVESLFELHLDVYFRITNPSSQVDRPTRAQQRDRLTRWADLASTYMNHYARRPGLVIGDRLVLRFIWASTIYASKSDEDNQEHIIRCLDDLRGLLERAGSPVIVLPNNAAMPEISVKAVQQEISKLTTLEFFTSVFDSDSSNPIGVIESLEPILEGEQEDVAPHVNGDDIEDDSSKLLQEPEAAVSLTQKLKDFLNLGDASLKLFLWRRLREAYQTINYTPKVVSCYLRALETIVEELDSERYADCDDGTRQLALLRWIRDADDVVAKLLSKVQLDSNAYEFLDQDHARTSIASVARLSTCIHAFALYEDEVRVGKINASTLKSSGSVKAFEKIKEKFRDVQIRFWTLQYTLLKDGMQQDRSSFPEVSEDLLRYLRAVHNSMGIRQYCRCSSKIFLKLMKSELITSDFFEQYSFDIAQVLYDLYQMKFVLGGGDFDHGCAAEPLDKKTALQMVDITMSQVRKMSVKDLIKNDLRLTVEKIQQTIGSTKSTPITSHNKKIISAYLKSTVNAKQLYQCIRGVGDLATRPVPTEASKLADIGWYFLLGQMALTRFRSTKRVTPTPTDDLDIAAAFFRQDLEHGVEKWETWYHLAQVYDARLEDDLLWAADKINNHRQELATLQRNAIHAYSMAAAVAMRSLDAMPETLQKISDMYADFATRLYASSREPLSMDAFKVDQQQKFFSAGTLTYKALPYPAMHPYAVWSLAESLLRKALIHKPKAWIAHYLRGKCLWKMFNAPGVEGSKRRVQVEDVIEAFTAAVDTLPLRRDSRSDYILEPHFKLVSVVHKLVNRKVITPQQGQQALKATSYARNVHLSSYEEDQVEWEPFILEILRKLGHADKSNWHHRIIARAAHVLFDDQKGMTGALGAKHEFTQQIFTKTMTLQVWKPEHERAGRHFVYTSRYASFFVEILSNLNDRTSLESLIRRVRRKPSDYLNHQELWEVIVTAYVKTLRRVGKIGDGKERFVFDNLNYETFSFIAEKLEKWAHDSGTTSIVLDILRDAIELKKVNNSLMKGTLIEDLITDAYASLYEVYVSQLPLEERKPPLPTPEPIVNSFVAATVQPSLDDGRDRMRLGNIMQQTDGPPERATPQPIPSSAQPIGLGLQTAPIFIGTPPPPSIASYATMAGQLRVTTPTPAVLPSKPGRVKQITRREIQRKAEGVVVRPPPIKTPILTKKPIIIEVPPPSRDRRRSESRDANDDAGSALGTRIDELMKDDAAASSELSSRRGSLHDSADDESELSDIEEHNEEGPVHGETKTQPLFPGLLAAIGGGAAEDDEDHQSSAMASTTEDKMQVDDDVVKREPTIDRNGHPVLARQDESREDSVEIADSQGL